MQDVWKLWLDNPVIIVLAGTATLLLVHFLWQYVFRGFRLRAELIALTRNVRALASRPRAELRRELHALFAGKRTEHAWSEFDETLHDQFETHSGVRRLRDVRATLPAEAFINLENTVDPRIGAEYFKHLPGLLTGLGIVGTFLGLIQGLLGFKPDVDSEALKHGLVELFSHVQSAFVFSAIAILSAMVVTFAEKWIYSSCSKWVGELTSALDNLFRAGVGEEYLSGLLHASQENATQTRQLKESMVDDLKVLLTNLTERQIQATQQLSVDLGKQIEGSFKQPLAHLVETVRQASGQQSTATSNVLENLMSAFIAQMREAVGGQLGGLSSLMQQTATSIAQVEAAMRSLLSDMQQTNAESTQSVSAAVRELLVSMSEQQRSLADSADQNSRTMLERVQATVAKIEEQQASLMQRTQSSVLAVSGAMENRIAALSAANDKTHDAVGRAITSLQEISSEAITGMGRGAEAMNSAVGSLQSATERLARITDQIGGLHTQIVRSSDQLTQASNILAGSSQSLATSSSTLGTVSTRFDTVAQQIAAESDSRSSLLQDLRTLMDQSRNAGAQFTALTMEVKSSLGSSVEAFGGTVSKVLSEHLHEYQKQLGNAISTLSVAIDELAELADRANPSS
jgi:ABC-type transporter Mla subunit MlaD